MYYYYDMVRMQDYFDDITTLDIIKNMLDAPDFAPAGYAEQTEVLKYCGSIGPYLECVGFRAYFPRVYIR